MNRSMTIEASPIWSKINPRNWGSPREWDWVAITLLGFVVVLMLFLCVGLPFMIIADNHQSDEWQQYNNNFASRCSAIPGSYTIISVKDECLVAQGNKIVVKFREP